MMKKLDDKKGEDNRYVHLPQLMVVFISLIIIANFAYAASTNWLDYLVPDAILPDFWNTGINNEVPDNPNYGWIGLSYMALMVGVSIAVLAYLLGAVFGNKLKVYAKHSLSSIGKTAIILTLIVAVFFIMDYAPGTPLGASRTQVEGAINFAATMKNTMTWEFITMTVITAMISMIGNMTPYLRPAGMIGISFSLAPAFKPIFDSLGIMLSTLSVSVGSWFIQYWILIFIKTRMLQLFLPIGLFLRALGTERAGNVLIAIALGFFFIYPFMVNVTAFSLEQYLRSEFGGEKALWGSPDDPNNYFNSYEECISHSKSVMGENSAHCFFKLSFFGSLMYMKEFYGNVGATGTIMSLGILQLLTGSLTSTVIISFMIIFTLSLIKTTVFYVLIASILVPLFNAFITLTVIKEFTKLLGTDIDLTAFEKIF